MMEEGNITILVDAKQEYTKQLINTIKNNIYSGIQTIYKEALNECIEKKIRKKTLLKFQERLSQIPKWTSERVDKEYNIITEKTQCDWIDDLLTAVFITHTKILTIVHKGGHNKKINLKIPKASHFIHLCYIETAREFWKNPYLFSEKVSQYDYQRNMRDSLTIISDTITETIRKQLPVKHILKEYLGDSYQSDIEDDDDANETIEQDSTKKHIKDIKKMVHKSIQEQSPLLNIKNENDLESLIKKEVSKQISTESFQEHHENTSQPEPVTTSQPEPVTTSQPEPVTTSQPEPVTTSQPEPVTTSQPEPVTTSQPEPVTTSQPEPVTTSQPEPELNEEELSTNIKELLDISQNNSEKNEDLNKVNNNDKPSNKDIGEDVGEDVNEDVGEDVDVDLDSEVDDDDLDSEVDDDDLDSELGDDDDLDSELDEDDDLDSELDEDDDLDSELGDDDDLNSELDEDDDLDSELDEGDDLDNDLDITEIDDLDIQLDDYDLDNQEVDLETMSESNKNSQILNNKKSYSFYD